MTTVVLGAGAVGTATAWYLKKAGHDVVLVERQPEAGMETSWGNGGVIHASEVEPWSQPGMPTKIIKWLGKENAPLLLRYGAIPHMFRWGLDFARNCTPERFRANSKSNLASGPAFAEIAAGDRRGDGDQLRSRHPRRAEDLSLPRSAGQCASAPVPFSPSTACCSSASARNAAWRSSRR